MALPPTITFVCHDRRCDVVVDDSVLPDLPDGVRISFDWFQPGEQVPYLDDGFHGDSDGFQVLIRDGICEGFYRDGVKSCCGQFGL